MTHAGADDEGGVIYGSGSRLQWVGSLRRPRQDDAGRSPTPPMMGLVRSVRRTLDDGPVSMQFDQLTAVDRPQESGTGQVV